MKIFGQTVQETAPTTYTQESPIASKIVREIKVSDSSGIVDTVILSKPIELRGLKKAKKYSNTEINGVPYISDYIDVEKGCIVRNVERGIINKNNGFKNENMWHIDLNTLFRNKIYNNIGEVYGQDGNAISNRFRTQNKAYKFDWTSEFDNCIYIAREGMACSLPITLFNSTNPNNGFFEQYPTEIYAQTVLPYIEYLPKADRDALKSLTMCYMDTTIENDAGCNMELEYTVDTKSYVDTKIAEISGAVIAQKGI